MRLFTIGRHPSCDLIVDAPDVSRLHARLMIEDGCCQVEDLGSNNGTTVNGRPTIRTRLHPKDELRVADHVVRWQQLLADGNYSQTPVLACSRVSCASSTGTGTAYRLKEVSFALKRGQLMAIIGPSGAGKTTLLRVLTGAMQPTNGVVMMHGQDLYGDIENLRPLLGYVPQDDIVHLELLLYDALFHAARLRVSPAESPAETKQRVLRTADTCGLRPHLGKRIRDLSGGERKRSSIAVELLTSPEIMFFDEPTSGLDPALERSFMQLSRKLADEGRVVVVTTHTTRSIELCDLLLIMAPGGCVVYCGPPKYVNNHFGVNDVADVYQLLSANSDAVARLGSKYTGSRIYQRYVVQVLAKSVLCRETESGISLARVPPLMQLWVLLQRQLAIFAGDPVNTGILLLQAPIIVIIIMMVFPFDSFTVEINHAPAVVFIMTISGIWFGVSNAARELVKERTIFRRERTAGLNRLAYLGSKLLLLLLLAGLQTLMLLAMLAGAMECFGLDGFTGLMKIWGLLWLASANGVVMGLALSALSKSSDQAISLTPVVLLPQVIFSGIFAAIERGSDVLSAFSKLLSSNWCFASLGNITNLHELLAAQPGGADVFSRAPGEGAAILMLMLIFFAFVTYLLLWHGERQ